MNKDDINRNNPTGTEPENDSPTTPLNSAGTNGSTPIESQPATEPAAPRRKYASPVNPAPASEPKISKARFANAAKQKTETNGSSTAQKGKQTSVPMCSPNKKWWVRCHPSPEMVVSGLTLLTVEENGMDEIYVLDPELVFPDDLDNFITPATVTRAITSQGNEFSMAQQTKPEGTQRFCPPCPSGAKRTWIQVRWNSQLKGYTYIEPRELRRDPVWSDGHHGRPDGQGIRR